MQRAVDIFFQNFFKLFTAFVIIASFIYILLPFLVPFIFGGMLAMALSPFIFHFMENKKWSREKSIGALSLGIFFLGLFPLIIFAARGTKIITQFFSEQSFTTLTQSIQEKIYSSLEHLAIINNFDPVFVKEKFDETFQTSMTFIFKTFSGLVSQVPDLVLAGIVTMLSFYFFLLKEDYIRSLFDRYFYFSEDNADKFIRILKSCCKEVFFSNVLTGILQSLIVSIGAFICGIGDFYIIFVITFIISFIPVVGAAPMAFLLALFAFIDGRMGAGITMSIIGAISGVADNLIRPYLASLGIVEVPAFIGFLAVIGGVIAFGLPGLFVGPLLASMMYGIIPIIFDEYFIKND